MATQRPQGKPPTAILGCLMVPVGAVSGAMIAVLLSKLVATATHATCNIPDIPTCDWNVYAGWGALFGAVTLISARMPALGAGISASTLSVEISKIGSSRFTSSPIFLSQRESVPSAMDSPICGMMMSTRATGSTSVGDVGRRAHQAPEHQQGQRDRA